MGVEEAKYTVILKANNIEVRQYDAFIVAETPVESSLTDAGNIGFRRLFKYISGTNKKKQKIAMTSPVLQAEEDNSYAVSFLLPASYSMESAPLPTAENVKLRTVPSQRIAAIQYSGRWTENGYLAHKNLLEAWMKEQKLTPNGPAIWARYDPPFTPFWMRRNEVLIPVKTPEAQPSDDAK